MFKERVVIPPSLRRRVLKQFHSNHPGTNRMKAIARGYAYWPGMDNDIEGIVKGCLKCQLTAAGQFRENTIPWPEIKKTMESSACRFRRPHQWSNLLSFDRITLQMARSYYNVVDKCLGYYQCSWQNILYAWPTRNDCVGQRDTIHCNLMNTATAMQ